MKNPPAENPQLGEWPGDGLEAVPVCPVCRSVNRRLLYEGLHDRVFFCAPGKWSLHQCLECTAAFIDPRPTPGTIGLAYSKYYTHDSATAGALKKTNWRKKFRQSLLHGYINARFGYKLTPATPLHRLMYSASQRRGADRWIRHMKFSGGNPRLLDLGCGNGGFLLQMQKAGWDVSGLEPDLLAVEAGKKAGLNVNVGTLQKNSYPPDHFEAITMSHVIEHLHNPVEVLRCCHEILRPGGTLWIATPNLNSIGHSAFGRDWMALDPPRHLVIFTPASLKAALQKIGFEVQPTPPVANMGKFLFRASGAIARNRDPYAKSSLSMIEKWWLKRQGHRADRRALKQPELDEELVVIATKQN